MHQTTTTRKPILLRVRRSSRCDRGSVNGGFDVQAGGGEDGYRAVRVGDQQFDPVAAEHDTFGAGLYQTHDGVAVGLPGLLADDTRQLGVK